jgi:hypothetical protein
LLRRPRTKHSATHRYRTAPGRSAYRAYPHRLRKKNSPLSRSFRSATQATDSTCSGCTPNSAAAKPLRHTEPVIRESTKNSSTVLRRWKKRLTRWCAPDRVEEVEKEADQVVRAGVQAEQRHVRHVREPGQRVPVRGVERREGPGRTGQRQAALDRRVLRDVHVIVERDEPVVPDPRIDEEGHQDKGRRHKIGLTPG